MKHSLKTIAHRTLTIGKKMVGAGVKSKIKTALLPYFGLNPKADALYAQWLTHNLPDAIAMPQLKRAADALKYRPLISIIVPTYNTKPEFLRDCFESVLAQAYDNWQLCVVDDASPQQAVRDIITEYAQLDNRITYTFLKENQHIAGATNQAIALAKGEFVSLFDHDDILWPNALYEIVKALNKDPTIDFLYTDEDKITENRKAYQAPFFKPDWNPDFLHSVNYITHFSTIRKTLLDKVGGLQQAYNGAQDWDLFLRISNSTGRIYHIPQIVYSWRIHELSTAKSTDTKPYVIEAQKKAIEADLQRKGHGDALVKQDPVNPGYWRVEYPVRGEPLVSIIITYAQPQSLKRCLDAIYKKTTYKHFEIIVVDSTEEKNHSLYKAMQSQYAHFQVMRRTGSSAHVYNEAARVANGELLVFLDGASEIVTDRWLEMLAGHAQRQEIGAVGCLIMSPDKRQVQQAGIGIGVNGVAGNLFSTVVNQGLAPHQYLYLNTIHNISAVSAACLMVRKSLCEDVGGFDEAAFPDALSDVDFCLRVQEKGYHNLYTPQVTLIQHQAKEAIRDQAAAAFKDRWASYIQHDPHINPHINRRNSRYEVDPQRRYGL